MNCNKYDIETNTFHQRRIRYIKQERGEIIYTLYTYIEISMVLYSTPRLALTWLYIVVYVVSVVMFVVCWSRGVEEILSLR